MDSKYNLQGRCALITGAGRRLGRAAALKLASYGADIVVHYGHSASDAEETVKDALSHGVKAIALQADLAKDDQVSSLFDQAIASFSHLDLLVNNASIFESLGFLETSLAEWDRHFSINLTAPFLLSQAFARHISDRPGSIVNLLDWRALRPGIDHFPYTITKSGLAAMTRSLARALAPNIRVNGLALGAILPPPGAKKFSDSMIKQVPAGRPGTVEETIDSLLFLLAGPDFITGEILHVDGGRQLV
jgi:NAD(P)-dependent dehydrogenase (short-subunit alcohol dehydrogenase family)